MRRIEIITTGTELMSARTLDTNFQEMVRALQKHGITVQFHSTYRDHFEELVDGVQRAAKRAGVIVLTGGLGPTSDDLTREVASETFKRPLIRNPKVLNRIRERLKKYGFRRLKGTEKQADFPEGSDIIPNPVGSAPGFYIHHTGLGPRSTVYPALSSIFGPLFTVHFFALPGVPREMQPMFHRWVLPRIVRLYRNEDKHVTLYVKTYGLPEIAVEQKVRPYLTRQKDVTYGLTVGHGPVNVSVTAQGATLRQLDRRLEKIHARLKKILGKFYLGDGDCSLEGVVGGMLLGRKRTLAVAESCTGGLIGHKLTNVPGISKVLLESVVCYSNESKVKRLGVRPETLRRYGAVSAETADEMARGIAQHTNAEFGLSTTGIAGPAGGTARKPVGLVYFALSYRGTSVTRKHMFAGDREQIKERAANMALNLLRLELMK